MAIIQIVFLLFDLISATNNEDLDLRYQVSSTEPDDPKSWIMPVLLGIAFLIFVCSSLYINLKKISVITY